VFSLSPSLENIRGLRTSDKTQELHSNIITNQDLKIHINIRTTL